MEKNNHRQIMNSEINQQLCILCKETHFHIEIHHIDGNKKNNKKTNLLHLCEHCHHKIHSGLSKKDISKDNEWKNYICHFRKIWLKNKYNFDDITLEKKINNEKLKASKNYIQIFIRKKICYICGVKKELIYTYPSYLNHPDYTNIDKKKFAIPFCESCFKKFKFKFKDVTYSTL